MDYATVSVNSVYSFRVFHLYSFLWYTVLEYVYFNSFCLYMNDLFVESANCSNAIWTNISSTLKSMGTKRALN